MVEAHRATAFIVGVLQQLPVRCPLAHIGQRLPHGAFRYLGGTGCLYLGQILVLVIIQNLRPHGDEEGTRITHRALIGIPQHPGSLM